MRTPSAESAHRLGELALLTTAFVLPLAFCLRAYDTVSIKFAVLQWGSLTLLLSWLWQGLSCGRFQVSVNSWTTLLPAVTYGAWMLVRFAAAPHAVAAFPYFAIQLTMLIGFLAAFLGFAGARLASRFATLTVIAAWIIALHGLMQALGLDPLMLKGAFDPGFMGAQIFSTVGNPYLCACFLAVAVPLALTLALDPETQGPLRMLAFALVPVAAITTILTGSLLGMAAFCASCLLYAIITPLCLRAPAALKSAVIAAMTALAVGVVALMFNAGNRESWSYKLGFLKTTAAAELRMFAEKPLAGFGPGSFFVHYPRFRPVEVIQMTGPGRNTMALYPEFAVLGVAVELGALGVALWLWLFTAALWTGARGAVALRRAGALSESVYAAGFTAAAAGGLAIAHSGFAGSSPATGWYAWPLAGLAAGLAPLAARRAAVSVYPLPISDDIRRALYAPSLLVFLGLAMMPGLWLRSDIDLNSAMYFANKSDYPTALSLFLRVRPGSANYPMALYFAGNALSAMGKHDEALAAYDRLQTQAPDYVLVHAARGAAYAKLGDWKSAAAERARQAEIDPSYLENLLAWAEAARASGNLSEARLAIGKAVELDPKSERVRLEIAANDLMERRLSAGNGQGKTNGRSVAKKKR